MIKDTYKYADGEDEKGRHGGRRQSFYELSPNLHMFTNPESLQTLTSGGFIEALLESSLVKSSAIDNGFKF